MKTINPFAVLRKLRSYFLRKKLKDKAVTIISNNCTAGIIYNVFGLKFLSPTINLQISDEDFPFFINSLRGFLLADVIEKKTKYNYPVGVITFEGKSVEIHFKHYRDFQDAKLKWDERKARVNESNICVVWMINNDITDAKINCFLNLKIDKKMLITYKEINANGVLSLDIFNKKNYKNGEVFWYKNWFSVKRNIEKIDFISFLNNGECKYE